MKSRLAVAFLIAFPSVAQGIEPGRHTLEGPEVGIHNLAGEMRIVEGTGRSVVVEITTQGRDRDRLTVEMRRHPKGYPELCVIYPETDVVYPDFGFGSGSSRSRLEYLKRRYSVTGRGNGLEAHADIRILVPRGKKVHAENAVGRAFVAGVNGHIALDAATAEVRAERVSGALSVDVGSGGVTISRCSGAIAVDAGSGGIALSDVDGPIALDAGSGDIHLERVGSDAISVDAGSGSITGSDIRASSISADCGSGAVELDGTSAQRLALEAGSGSVHLRLTRNVDALAIEAGSGSVKIEAPENLSAQVKIECPSKSLRIDFPMDLEVRKGDLTVGRIGSGRGRIVIEAGSGRVDLLKM